jgi:hypothetical protein
MSQRLSRRQVFGVGGIGWLGLLHRCWRQNAEPEPAAGHNECTVFRYDNLTRLTNGCQVTVVTYDGKTPSVTDAGGSITTLTYDGWGRIG